MLEKVRKFFKEVSNELKKVSWPTRQETISSTVVVIVLVFIVSLYLGIIDVILARFIGLFIG
jgi:preprotein translocase subunit SecE